jgi:hypothetical protein
VAQQTIHYLDGLLLAQLDHDAKTFEWFYHEDLEAMPVERVKEVFQGAYDIEAKWRGKGYAVIGDSLVEPRKEGRE